jgi:two-component system, OmpR family, alkaline phosphatase synthesis response regulator PhoP
VATTARILLVEDNHALARSLADHLAMEGYVVEIANDGPSAIEAAAARPPQLMILDLMLPGLNGYEVLEHIRRQNTAVPVLIVSALGEEGDRVRGFRGGADQYLTKPFGLLEFLERVRLLLRRHQKAAADSARVNSRIGRIEVDFSARRLVRDGCDINVSPRAFDLLIALYEADGRVLSRVGLLQRVWGHRSAVLTRTVDAHIAQLRRAIEDDPSRPRHIITVRKAGYRLQR